MLPRSSLFHRPVGRQYELEVSALQAPLVIGSWPVWVDRRKSPISARKVSDSATSMVSSVDNSLALWRTENKLILPPFSWAMLPLSPSMRTR